MAEKTKETKETTDSKSIWAEEEVKLVSNWQVAVLRQELEEMTNEDISQKTRLFESNIRAMRSDMTRLSHENGK